MTDCPNWCTVDHAEARSHKGPLQYTSGAPFARAMQDPSWPNPRILIDVGVDDEAWLFLDPSDATRLAAVLDHIGAADLAERIRQAVAVLNPQETQP